MTTAARSPPLRRVQHIALHRPRACVGLFFFGTNGLRVSHASCRKAPEFFHEFFHECPELRYTNCVVKSADPLGTSTWRNTMEKEYEYLAGNSLFCVRNHVYFFLRLCCHEIDRSCLPRGVFPRASLAPEPRGSRAGIPRLRFSDPAKRIPTVGKAGSRQTPCARAMGTPVSLPVPALKRAYPL